MSLITVAVVDDHDMVAESLALVLDSEEDMHVVGIATSLSEARELVARARPDVVLLDAMLGMDDAIAAIPQLRELHHPTKILVLTATTSDHVLMSALTAGAVGFLTKSGGVREVVSAVRAAARDESVLSHQLMTRLLPLMRPEAHTTSRDLSPRELEVLSLVARGMTNAAIAEELVISLHTVRNHVASLSTKLGAHSKLEALSVALRLGLVAPV